MYMHVCTCKKLYVYIYIYIYIYISVAILAQVRSRLDTSACILSQAVRLVRCFREFLRRVWSFAFRLDLSGLLGGLPTALVGAHSELNRLPVPQRPRSAG